MSPSRQTRVDLKAFGRWFVTGRDPEVRAAEPNARLRLQLAPPLGLALTERRSRAERAVEAHWPVRVVAVTAPSLSRRRAGGTRP